jgi:hypothetical protein
MLYNFITDTGDFEWGYDANYEHVKKLFVSITIV